MKVRNVLVMALLATLALPVYATEYMFMGFDTEHQLMYAVIRGDEPFTAQVNMELSAYGGYISELQVVQMDPTEVWAISALSPFYPGGERFVEDGDLVYIDCYVDLFDVNGEPIVTLDGEDTLMAHIEGDNGHFTYQNPCHPILPDSIRRGTAFCAFICHGTYTLPVVCEFPGPYVIDPRDIEIFVENGCHPDRSHCDSIACPQIDWNLFTWRIRSYFGCYIFLTMTYCDAAPGCVCIYRSDQVLPVEFRSFEAIPGDGRVVVNWQTGGESNLDEYILTRSENLEAPAYEPVAYVPARNSASGASYSWSDTRVSNGRTYYYKLHVRQSDGSISYYNVDGRAVIVSATPRSDLAAAEYRLAQNYPNPFNSQTRFTFTLPTAGLTSLKVFDVMGREVATVVQRDLSAGAHAVDWSADGLTSGIYLYTLTSGGFTATQKMLYLK